MSKQSLKKWALLLTFWVALHTTALKAQTVLYSGTSPAVLQMEGTSGILEGIGTYGTGTLSLSGAGTRMVWYPGKAAFRAGYVDGTQWNNANIGNYSVAFGYDAIASGVMSTALTFLTTASGNYSLAAGPFSSATTLGSTALGYSTLANGTESTALGVLTTASGPYSVAMGLYSIASGNASTTMGHQNTASGDRSLATGFATVASGKFSSSFGAVTSAVAYSSFAVGANNIGGGTSTSWVATDPLFEVGNGGDGSGYGDPTKTTPSDALIVYKNGNAALHGALRAAAGGDITMGGFTAGTAP